MNCMSKLNLWKLGSLVLIIFGLHSAWADNYPSKPINFIVPYGAGGGADARSRQIAQKMSVILKQPIIVDNKPGAGGNIGTEYIARANPDGYTIGMGNFAPMAVNKTLFGNLRYDPEADLTPIVLVEKGPLVLVVNPNSPYKTVQDIVAAAKAKPGSLTFSSGGIGGSHQLSAELFQQNAGIEMIHVPYKSGSAGLTDLMAGNVTMMFDQMYSAMPSIKADKLRPIAITSKKRSPLLPDVPSFAEVGYPKVVVLNWQGLIAPKGTPKVIIDKLNAAANEALKDPQLRDLMLSQGNEIGGGSPADFAALIKSESAKWGAVVKLANIKPE
ncbi:tripartite tricarboxylate transporter substrate binding protein [Polynucleobacter paneuropaeus]|uniref:Tripartite tricarboxylate transporter substrate binding protein n=2 Tax=Polynucleobacter paneuropaeus TaxID=2527775 RepID=A0A9Q2WJ68_9BURK|nr:tripartite tricarboxylate transporter substrate binding protein [Polynucleobacter paneuropaeus]MBT8522181.1 tripartite tricarboxylate transporter substrate binding protein [Polynucleobacter paneuropaeus]MBT8535975.1 tripartite tricarboxylate transporter substrate binding protein [Polynucleobacter paneuropaeus]MBT8538284.1 tripartite tricarboxylate transporter substrate binding protein [Polynucleobacter paneuropaeus]MBT8539776.1 tripartite tricarboxylate transporter substrate binding protein 